MSRLTGKVVIVTGSGTGIGRAIALRAAAEGAAVVIHDRLAELVPPAVAAVEAAGARAVGHVEDLTADGCPERLVQLV
jgi:NAD(P)-dependent dehydrogenase (short-subunit alcohol dehydrogenase family)